MASALIDPILVEFLAAVQELQNDVRSTSLELILMSDGSEYQQGMFRKSIELNLPFVARTFESYRFCIILSHLLNQNFLESLSKIFFAIIKILLVITHDLLNILTNPG